MTTKPRSLVALSFLVLVQICHAGPPVVAEIDHSLVDDMALNFPAGGSTKFSTSVNGKSFQQWPMQTFKGYQYVTYYDHDRHVCVGRRKLPSGNWEVIRFRDYKNRKNDSHNVTVIGIAEGDGSIHLAFDHHADVLKYRYTAPGVATDPEHVEWNASLFSEVVHELGPVGRIGRLTYPRFIPKPDGNLLFYYREVTSGNGDSVIREYDSNTHQWRAGLGKFIARDIGTFTWGGKTSRFRCAYLNAISYAGNRLHVSWVWRDLFEKTSPRNNHDLCYAYSDDDGRTWKNNAGQVVAVTGSSFITIDTPGITVVPIPPRQGLINQCTHYAYPDGTIHVVLLHNVAGTKEAKYHHYWRDVNGEWHAQALPYSGSRPTLVGDHEKNLLLVFTSGGRTQIVHGAPDATQTSWVWSKAYVQNSFTDGSEGVVDFSRWQQEQILSTYSQEKSNDPGGPPTPLRVIDYSWKGVSASKIARNHAGESTNKNVLVLFIDDLRPELGCYGVDYIKSPNIDKLSAEGVQFDRAYCQQAVCAPSRISMMTGQHPDTTGIYDLFTPLWRAKPDAMTLPRYFKEHGYVTASFGKVYHHHTDDRESWSELPDVPGAIYADPEVLALVAERKRDAHAKGLQGVAFFSATKGPATEIADVPDEAYRDGAVARQAIDFLQRNRDRPFFMCVGFAKPHLPFSAPRRYWDLYDREQFDVPPRKLPDGTPQLAVTKWGELRAYLGMPKDGPLTDEQTRELRHGYAACVSFTDAQVGKVLDELDKLGLRENTVIVLWGDHGYKLGDYGLWCKHTNLELDTRVPLIISAPGYTNGQHSSALVEIVDLFPTLVSLTGGEIPPSCEGRDLTPLLSRPDAKGREFAVSQYPRGSTMGYSLRTERWRYTEWIDVKTGEIRTRELYDHRDSAVVDRNLVDDPRFAGEVSALAQLLDANGRARRLRHP